MSDTRIYGLVGKELGHSFSRKYFLEKFEKEHLNCDYVNFELPTIEECETLFQNKQLCGFNVTIPYKEHILSFLSRLDPEAEAIGAVNTVLVQNGKGIGYNTDAFGFRQMIKPFFKSHHERALILGTGGASKAVEFVLEGLGVNVLRISRIPEGPFEFAYDDINEMMLQQHLLIVNCTPVGMFPDVSDYPDLPYQYLTPNHLVVDLIYNPEKTVFLQKAAAQGAVVLNGKTMLEQQAERAWQIWNEK